MKFTNIRFKWQIGNKSRKFELTEFCGEMKKVLEETQHLVDDFNGKSYF